MLVLMVLLYPLMPTYIYLKSTSPFETLQNTNYFVLPSLHNRLSLKVISLHLNICQGTLLADCSPSHPREDTL